MLGLKFLRSPRARQPQPATAPTSCALPARVKPQASPAYNLGGTGPAAAVPHSLLESGRDVLLGHTQAQARQWCGVWRGLHGVTTVQTGGASVHTLLGPWQGLCSYVNRLPSILPSARALVNGIIAGSTARPLPMSCTASICAVLTSGSSQ